MEIINIRNRKINYQPMNSDYGYSHFALKCKASYEDIKNGLFRIKTTFDITQLKIEYKKKNNYVPIYTTLLRQFP